MATTLLIADSGPLIILAKVRRLELLLFAAQEIVTVPAVFDEVTSGQTDVASDAVRTASKSWLQVRPAPVVPDRIRRFGLGRGEEGVLALGLTEPDSVVLVDEVAARRAARAMDIRVTGVLGILRLAKELGALPRVTPVVEQMILHDYRLGPALIRQFLVDVGEVQG